MRSSNGCWTCRLRRKKCDEKRPVCNACATLEITCHFNQNEKPQWMDGGIEQETKAEQLKREIKENASRRRELQIVPAPVNQHQATTEVSEEPIPLHSESLDFTSCPSNSVCTLDQTSTETHHHVVGLPTKASPVLFQCELDRELAAFNHSDYLLLTFFLNHLFPFMFPFYRPTLLQGDRAWVLEMIMNRPVVRQAFMCQSSYFFLLTQGSRGHDTHSEIERSRGTFSMLRKALGFLNNSSISQHPHCAVRILASIMQVQRFEISTSRFTNCQAHLNAAIAIFEQLVSKPSPFDVDGCSSHFSTILLRLASSSYKESRTPSHLPSGDQAAFRFASALLILDDIVASTVLQEPPRLYDYHHSLLGDVDDTEPAIQLEAVLGCENWVMLQLSEIAALDARKQRLKREGSLDIIELVHHATTIKDILEARLGRLETTLDGVAMDENTPQNIFTSSYFEDSNAASRQRALVTRVWAHAALVYLHVILSGWQPASLRVRYHVSRVIELLTHQISPPALLRTMAWPFCVAGCLAEPTQEVHFHRMVELLQPSSAFGTVYTALEIMEKAWASRSGADTMDCDIATCFRRKGALVLLV